MIKAYPRVWVDLTTTEVLSVILQILKPAKARGKSLLPEFERSYAEFIGTREAVSFTNCRSAYILSLRHWISMKVMRLLCQHLHSGQKQQLLSWQV